jgi:D-alanyl-D-alanine carboxypeptidase/D-alanyl-D-alanine-endopeptidase (penicillin-binding protein 4)
MLKFSDNQIAETMLRTLGTLTGDGSAEDGLAVVESTLSGWGIEPDAYSLVDGSGMSRYSEIAPTALARLLRRTSQLPGFRVYVDALPVASVDGTLSRRFRSTAASRVVRAKTGSLSGVRSLAGYAVDGDGETLVFALLLNGYDSPNSVATALEDLLIEQLALYHGPAYPQGRPGPWRQ